ncbi:(2Fe-2S)-binding protein [Streptomyces sp. ZYX-F-203]
MTPYASARAPAKAVATALEDAATLGGCFAVTLGGPERGWRPVTDAYPSGFGDLAGAIAERYDTRETRVGASLAHLGHAARLWSPVLACALGHGIVLDLSGLHRADHAPALRLPRPTGWYAEGLPPLAGTLYRVVVGEHLAPLAAALRPRLAPRLLDGNAASALTGTAQVLLRARPELRRPLTALTAELLATGRLADTGRLTDRDLAFRRRSCCLFYRTPSGGKCGDCCLAP